MMDFGKIFSNLKELESSAIAFRHGYPVGFVSFKGHISSFSFNYEEYKEYEEKKILSRNNGTMCWIDNHTLFVIPRNLGNAEDILLDAGYKWDNEYGNNYYVPLSNGENLTADELKETWLTLRAVSNACLHKC